MFALASGTQRCLNATDDLWSLANFTEEFSFRLNVVKQVHCICDAKFISWHTGLMYPASLRLALHCHHIVSSYSMHEHRRLATFGHYNLRNFLSTGAQHPPWKPWDLKKNMSLPDNWMAMNMDASKIRLFTDLRILKLDVLIVLMFFVWPHPPRYVFKSSVLSSLSFLPWTSCCS